VIIPFKFAADGAEGAFRGFAEARNETLLLVGYATFMLFHFLVGSQVGATRSINTMFQ